MGDRGVAIVRKPEKEVVTSFCVDKCRRSHDVSIYNMIGKIYDTYDGEKEVCLRKIKKYLDEIE
jgi:hypothetical protein